MNIREPFRSAFASLRANKMRSALTTLGVVIGVAGVITVVSLIQGLRGVALSAMERFGSNTITVQPVNWWDVSNEDWKKIKSRDMTMDNMRALKAALPTVIIDVSPFANASGTARHNGKNASQSALMTDEVWLEQNKLNLAMGRNFVPADMRIKAKVAIIGWRLIDKFGIRGNPIGQFILFQDMSLEIIGVMEELGATMLYDQDDFMIIPITTGMAILPDDQRRQLSFSAHYDPRLDAFEAEDIVRDTLRRIRGVKSNEVEGFKVTSRKREAGQFNTIIAAITGIAGSMVGIALVVGGIGVMNIMLVSVTERTREIGVRKAVGAKRSHIKAQFLVEAAALCLLGGALGLLIGHAIGTALSKLIFNQIRIIPIWAFAVGFGIPAAIGIVFGYYPASKASKLDPVESMRYE